MKEFPPIPIDATHFLKDYAYEIPTQIETWQWSYTFGCWGAIVVFADGKRCYTYPQHESGEDRLSRWLNDYAEENTTE